MTPEQLKALAAWQRWYSAKLDRINEQVRRRHDGVADCGDHEDYSPAEQDLFEAFGCERPDERER
jgi:hypothetical protein